MAGTPGEPWLAPSTAVVTEAVVTLLAHLHKQEIWQRVISTEIVERLGVITQYMQVQFKHKEMFCCTK